MDINALIKRVIGCAFIVHKELGSGFLEKVCENSTRIALEKENLVVVQQCSVPVMFHGKIVGDYIAD